MPPATTASGAGECGQTRSSDQQQDQRRHPDCQRDDGGLRKVLDEAQHVAEEALLRYVDAEQLRHLIEHDHETDAGLEAGQDRHRDEVRDEPETKHRSHDQQDPRQGGERRRRRDQPRRGLRPGRPAQAGRRRGSPGSSSS